jgi:hypothetical protein
MLSQCSRRCALNSIFIVIITASTVHRRAISGRYAIETAVMLELRRLSADLLGSVVSATAADLLDFLVEVMQSHNHNDDIDEA